MQLTKKDRKIKQVGLRHWRKLASYGASSENEKIKVLVRWQSRDSLESTAGKKGWEGKRKPENTEVPKEQGPLEENKWELGRTGCVQRGESPSSRFPKYHLGDNKAQESWSELDVKLPGKDNVKEGWGLKAG